MESNHKNAQLDFTTKAVSTYSLLYKVLVPLGVFSSSMSYYFKIGEVYDYARRMMQDAKKG